MRHFLIAIAALATAALPARAQVTIDLNALDGVKPPASAQPAAKPASKPVAKPAAKPVPKPVAAKPGASKPVVPSPAPGSAKVAAPGQPAIPPTPLPSGPPPGVTLAPLAAPPVAAPGATPSPVPPPAISPTAKGSGTEIPGGVRITFAAGQGELSPASAQAVQALVRATPRTDAVSFNVLAYADGTPEDPSSPRRVSLARALSVRSVLMAAGVPSTRIYMRALGTGLVPGQAPPATATPPDRVDINVLGANDPVIDTSPAGAPKPAKPPEASKAP